MVGASPGPWFFDLTTGPDNRTAVIVEPSGLIRACAMYGCRADWRSRRCPLSSWPPREAGLSAQTSAARGPGTMVDGAPGRFFSTLQISWSNAACARTTGR